MSEEPKAEATAAPSRLQRIVGTEKVIGEGFTIRRYLPSSQRRTIGAWCFLDHAGPVAFGPGQALHVGPHPHIGLQTFTWMVAGELMHRDSLGYEQIIRPGQVNLMTAGRGIAHAEDAVSDAAGTLHAAQLWIALPDVERRSEPAFSHYAELPILDISGVQVTVLAGSVGGETAPTKVYSPLMGMDVRLPMAGHTVLPLQQDFEHGVVVLNGELTVNGQTLGTGTLLYMAPGCQALRLEGSAAAHALIIGGEPFRERIALWWNFVARTREELVEAATRWESGRGFGTVHGSPTPPLSIPGLETIKIE